MADKALKNGIRASSVTFIADSSIAFDITKKYGSAHAGPDGKAVSMKSGGTVGLATNGETILGKLNKVEPDGFCSVQDVGYMDLPSDGTITYAAGNNGLVGGTTDGTVKSTGAAATNAQAIQSYTSGRIIARLS